MHGQTSTLEEIKEEMTERYVKLKLIKKSTSDTVWIIFFITKLLAQPIQTSLPHFLKITGKLDCQIILATKCQ
jgi:hypothetical protein